jgi:ribosome biogenesis GTPase / thiamine phosphate phosphatase
MKNIEKIGFDEWFRERVEGETGFEIARVVTVNKNSLEVTMGDGEIYAELTGKFLFLTESSVDFPVVGDWVYVQLFDDNTLAIIHNIFPRKTLLKRKTPGKRVDYQVIAANVDYAIIVQALDSNFNIRRLERYLVMINESKIVPIVLLSKKDLISEGEAEEKIGEIRKIAPDVKIAAFSNNNESDIREVESLFLPSKTYCLLGSSGVGKTTLLNNLISGELFKTQPIREKDGRGKHTTTRRELIVLERGAILIDNPGMRELGLMSVGSGLEETFDEIGELMGGCRYGDCTHTVEKGCAVLAAVERGEVTRERYDNYMKLYKEAVYNEMSYYEKKQKDKRFGKMVHNYLKGKGKE